MNKVTKSIIAGIVATAVMTMIMFIAPMMGMPKMNPAEMLSMTMGFPIAVGWVMHFMIGIIFAFIYAFFFITLLSKVNNNILKGAIFGVAAFVFAQIMMAIMGAMMTMPPMEGNKVLIMMGSLMGHIVFGIVIALFIKENN